MASASADDRGTRRLRAALIAWLCGLLCSLWSPLADAHPMPESRVWIATTPAGLELTLQLPLNRLEYGFGKDLADHASTLLAQYGDELSRYLLQHVGVRSGGQDWQASPPRLEVVGTDASAELNAVIELHAPAGGDARAPTLRYDAITHEVRTHRVLVSLRNDWAGGFVGRPPQLLGELSHGHDSLVIPLERSRTGAGVLSLLQGGALHIAEGTDHLLFLLMLLVVAPLGARQRRWCDVRPVRPALRHTALVVSAFTVGHTITLVLGSTGVLTLPAQPVEVAVAVTIAVAAVHAWRPLFATAEIWMAGGFGLIHGMAFSASLSGAGLTPLQHALALLSFNVGIEAMQLALLALVLPPLLMLSRMAPALYAAWRQLAAVAAVVLAGVWIAQRAGVSASWTPAWLEQGAVALAPLVGLLWITALASYGWSQRHAIRRSVPALAPAPATRGRGDLRGGTHRSDA